MNTQPKRKSGGKSAAIENALMAGTKERRTLSFSKQKPFVPYLSNKLELGLFLEFLERLAQGNETGNEHYKQFIKTLSDIWGDLEQKPPPPKNLVPLKIYNSRAYIQRKLLAIMYAEEALKYVRDPFSGFRVGTVRGKDVETLLNAILDKSDWAGKESLMNSIGDDAWRLHRAYLIASVQSEGKINWPLLRGSYEDDVSDNTGTSVYTIYTDEFSPRKKQGKRRGAISSDIFDDPEFQHFLDHDQTLGSVEDHNNNDNSTDEGNGNQSLALTEDKNDYPLFDADESDEMDNGDNGSFDLIGNRNTVVIEQLRSALHSLVQSFDENSNLYTISSSYELLVGISANGVEANFAIISSVISMLNEKTLCDEVKQYLLDNKFNCVEAACVNFKDNMILKGVCELG